MVKAEFSLFPMQVKPLFSDAFHFSQSKLGLCPERLNPIDVRLVINKLITSMFNAIMLQPSDDRLTARKSRQTLRIAMAGRKVRVKSMRDIVYG